MEYTAIAKYLRISPRKMQTAAKLVANLRVDEAINKLKFVSVRSAGILHKVISSALANAKQKGVNEANLRIKSVTTLKGPMMKRMQPVSRGTGHGYKKKMTHLRVVLIEEENHGSKN